MSNETSRLSRKTYSSSTSSSHPQAARTSTRSVSRKKRRNDYRLRTSLPFATSSPQSTASSQPLQQRTTGRRGLHCLHLYRIQALCTKLTSVVSRLLACGVKNTEWQQEEVWNYNPDDIELVEFPSPRISYSKPQHLTTLTNSASYSTNPISYQEQYPTPIQYQSFAWRVWEHTPSVQTTVLVGHDLIQVQVPRETIYPYYLQHQLSQVYYSPFTSTQDRRISSNQRYQSTQQLGTVTPSFGKQASANDSTIGKLSATHFA